MIKYLSLRKTWSENSKGMLSQADIQLYWKSFKCLPCGNSRYIYIYKSVTLLHSLGILFFIVKFRYFWYYTPKDPLVLIPISPVTVWWTRQPGCQKKIYRIYTLKKIFARSSFYSLSHRYQILTWHVCFFNVGAILSSTSSSFQSYTVKKKAFQSLLSLTLRKKGTVK